MILQSFEIENWSCIKHLAVDSLPSTGVIVLHGPNGTGKSSIVEALRACLMDNKSTSKALGRGFAKNSTEKPRVTVTFRAAGTSWRVMKQFNSKVSKLESQTVTGGWKLETDDASEAHDRTRQLTGGSDSSLGLHQLLWMTQAEFRLPDPKKFDADVQSQLRTILGVLQTPVDDRFIGRVKDEWSRWFGERSKPGEKPKLKKNCPLDKAQAALAQLRAELAETEALYQVHEKMMEKSGDLEVSLRDLRRQLKEKTSERDLLRQEYEKSLTRLEAHRLATERCTGAEKAVAHAKALQQRRADAEQRIREAESAAATARREVEERSRQLQAGAQKLRELRDDHQARGDAGRQLQARFNEVGERRQSRMLKEQLKAARDSLQRAEQTAGELEYLKTQARGRPAPDTVVLKRLEENRVKAARLRAELEAAAIALTLALDAGATAPRLAIDGTPAVDAGPPTEGTPIRRAIRRRAEITIPGWGRVELTRGSDARSLDQIEDELNDLDRKFADGLAPFGVAAGDPTALDGLRSLAAEQKARDPELKRKQEAMNRLAPQGLDPLRQEGARLEKLHQASEAEPVPQSERTQLPLEAAELERLAAQLKHDMKANDDAMAALVRDIQGLEIRIEGHPASERAAGKKPAGPGLREEEAIATKGFTELSAVMTVHRRELDRQLTTEQIEQEIRLAEEGLATAREELDVATLSESEETVRERLESADASIRALDDRLAAVQKELHQIEGGLRLSEGLHQKRAAVAARVEELERHTERETLESDAYDRLYALFEECRDKQFGVVLEPIHDRLLRWMRLLRIGGYQSVQFNDQFLPEKLIAGNGAIELALAEESTGTIEQIGLMVRLALGSALATPDEPVVAILDDPLTHSDVVRLDRMRAILKHAAAGDSSCKPPAGPMQIMVFTCHPEWFAIDGAKVIDLSQPEVLTR